MRLIMLGASLAQLPGIQMARAMGHEVITCDDQEDSIGHHASNGRITASTFDAEAVLRVAGNLAPDGIMTMGTDQPVLTAAIVASQLGLPSLLTVLQAQSVTDKRMMKALLVDCRIPTAPYVVVKKTKENRFSEDQLNKLRSLGTPVVVKPVDSQGQRGIYVLPQIESIEAVMDSVLAFSRTDEILVEQYYSSDEVTVSGWVNEGHLTVLTITDRLTFNSIEQIGICLSHEYPSRHMKQYGQALIDITRQIVNGFKIKDGPIYCQFLIGSSGIIVNEVASRIGGAFESQIIPRISGFNITRSVIQHSLGLKMNQDDTEALKTFHVLSDFHVMSVQLFFAEPCTIQSLTPLDVLDQCPGIIEAGYFKKEGQVIPEIRSATERVGYCLLTAVSKAQMEQRLAYLYQYLKVLDTNGHNRIIHRPILQS